MSEVSRFVLDASVAVKWFLKDENHVEIAGAVFTRFLGGEIELLAPTHIQYEIPHALLRAVRRGRISLALAREHIEDFFVVDVPTVFDQNLVLGGLDLAGIYGCSFYDGVCLALAQTSECPFLCADEKLRNLVGKSFPLFLWIEEYQ